MAAVDTKLGDFSHVDDGHGEHLVARLQAMNALADFRDYKTRTFDEMRLRAGADVADVGCGTGEDVVALKRLVGDTGRVTGFDASAAMLAEARRRHAAGFDLDLVQASSDRLDVPDDRLDAIRADRLLIHVPEPAATLAEMVRVVRPGGRVVVSEPDMPGLWIASDDAATTDLIVTAIAASCRHPVLPRHLLPMFRDAGLTELGFSVKTAIGYDPAAIDVMLDFSGVVASLVRTGDLAADRAEGWMREMLERAENGRFVAGLGIMIASGTKY